MMLHIEILAMKLFLALAPLSSLGLTTDLDLNIDTTTLTRTLR